MARYNTNQGEIMRLLKSQQGGGNQGMQDLMGVFQLLKMFSGMASGNLFGGDENKYETTLQPNTKLIDDWFGTLELDNGAQLIMDGKETFPKVKEKITELGTTQFGNMFDGSETGNYLESYFENKVNQVPQVMAHYVGEQINTLTTNATTATKSFDQYNQAYTFWKANNTISPSIDADGSVDYVWGAGAPATIAEKHFGGFYSQDAQGLLETDLTQQQLDFIQGKLGQSLTTEDYHLLGLLDKDQFIQITQHKNYFNNELFKKHKALYEGNFYDIDDPTIQSIYESLSPMTSSTQVSGLSQPNQTVANAFINRVKASGNYNANQVSNIQSQVLNLNNKSFNQLKTAKGFFGKPGSSDTDELIDLNFDLSNNNLSAATANQSWQTKTNNGNIKSAPLKPNTTYLMLNDGMMYPVVNPDAPEEEWVVDYDSGHLHSSPSSSQAHFPGQGNKAPRTMHVDTDGVIRYNEDFSKEVRLYDFATNDYIDKKPTVGEQFITPSGIGFQNVTFNEGKLDTARVYDFDELLIDPEGVSQLYGDDLSYDEASAYGNLNEFSNNDEIRSFQKFWNLNSSDTIEENGLWSDEVETKVNQFNKDLIGQVSGNQSTLIGNSISGHSIIRPQGNVPNNIPIPSHVANLNNLTKASTLQLPDNYSFKKGGNVIKDNVASTIKYTYSDVKNKYVVSGVETLKDYSRLISDDSLNDWKYQAKSVSPELTFDNPIEDFNTYINRVLTERPNAQDSDAPEYVEKMVNTFGLSKDTLESFMRNPESQQAQVLKRQYISHITPNLVNEYLIGVKNGASSEFIDGFQEFVDGQSPNLRQKINEVLTNVLSDEIEVLSYGRGGAIDLIDSFVKLENPDEFLGQGNFDKIGIESKDSYVASTLINLMKRYLTQKTILGTTNVSF